MRQFFSWRIWAAFGALFGLVVVLRLVLPANAATAPQPTGPPDRAIDFVSFVYQIQPGNGFSVTGGVVNGSADVIIDGQRTMHLVAGTPGELNCPEYESIGRCVVVADLLGEAVVWFELVPVQPGYKVNAAPIVAILEDGIVRLANGWLVRAADSVDRRCHTETPSLSDFIRDFGPGSTTIIDVTTQKVTAVVCAGASQSSTTTTTSAVTAPSAAGSLVPPG